MIIDLEVIKKADWYDPCYEKLIKIQPFIYIDLERGDGKKFHISKILSPSENMTLLVDNCLQTFGGFEKEKRLLAVHCTRFLYQNCNFFDSTFDRLLAVAELYAHNLVTFEVFKDAHNESQRISSSTGNHAYYAAAGCLHFNADRCLHRLAWAGRSYGDLYYSVYQGKAKELFGVRNIHD